MGELVGGYLLARVLLDLGFWVMGALVFKFVCIDALVRRLTSIDESLKCMPAARAMRAAEFRSKNRAA